MFPPRFPLQIQPQEKILTLEEEMLQLVNNTNKFMTETKTQLQSQVFSIQNLEVKLGQLPVIATVVLKAICLTTQK